MVGLLNDDVPEELADRHHKIATSADAIFGNSGGPALTQDGEFFGVMHAIAIAKPSLRDQVNPYTGYVQEWHSNVSGCQAIADFLAK